MMKKFLFNLLAGLALISCFSSCGEEEVTYQRDRDPWVFRSVLDEQPRMVTAALNENMYVAYDAQNAGLYKAWKGGVNFDGAVYTTVHGPQPTTKGYAFFAEKVEEPNWRILKDGESYTPEVNYKGHKFQDGQVYFNYQLKTKDGQIIKVSERPEYVENDRGADGLERHFITSDVPEGVQVGYKTSITSLKDVKDYSTSGKFEVKEEKENVYFNGKTISLDGMLLLNSNDETTLTVFYHPGFDATMDQDPKVKSDEDGEEIAYQKGQTLIFNSDCKTCHNEEVQTIGPAYKAVAEKYPFNEDNVAMLAKKVQEGGSGVWGETPMNAHPDLAEEDAKEMVRYIMSLDGEIPAEQEETNEMAGKSSVKLLLDASNSQFDPESEELKPGLATMVYKIEDYNVDFKELEETSQPVLSGVTPTLHVLERKDLGPEGRNVYMVFKGFIDIPETSNYVFRLVSDDGSWLYLKERKIIDNGGFHGPEAKDGEVYLQKGQHPIRVEYVQGGGGATISLQWAKYGDNEFQVVPENLLKYCPDQFKKVVPYIPREKLVRSIPGDQTKLQEVHPSFTLSQARPDDFQPKVGGMDFMSDGSLIVCTWDSVGGVYKLEGVIDNEQPIKVTQIASGLAEPLGLKVVDDEIYVLQKQELTKLIDHDGDGIVDEYETFSDDWQVSSNFHEFSFGLAYKEDHFYAALAIAIMPGGASAQPQIPDRGKVVKISRQDGSVEFIAHGLRTPNGVGIGVNNDVFIADNQGDWLPSSKIVPVKEGAFYGSRAVDFEGTADVEVTPPLVWLPQDEIGNSPTTPLLLNIGRYQNQMIHGEVTHGGVKRVFVEQIDGTYQGAVFRFIQGLEAGVNRMAWGPDGSLYVGGVGSSGNWQDDGKLWYGLQKLTYNDEPVFEPLAIRAKSNGIEVEFTEPIAIDKGHDKETYQIKQWYYKPTEDYGGPKLGLSTLQIKSVNISEDRKKLFLELPGMKEGHVVHFRVVKPFVSENNRELWTTEGWYTMNKIPKDSPGFSNPVQPISNNTLTEKEKQEGWKLLFDGKTTNGWRNYKSDKIGSAWKVKDGMLYLDNKNKKDWQIVDGGDIITDSAYDNYVLELEWKIEKGGNSGVIYHVKEDDKYEYVWQTGPEMQILDNLHHPDGRIEKHRAGDLYDLIQTKFVTVNPAGEWNRARLVSNNGMMEHWLNGYKVVEFDMNADSWNEMIRNSKFKDMPGFGQSQKGHIALQDHGDMVWFRNIKIKEL